MDAPGVLGSPYPPAPGERESESGTLLAARLRRLLGITALVWGVFALRNLAQGHLRVGTINTLACLGSLGLLAWSLPGARRARLRLGAELALALSVASLTLVSLLTGQTRAVGFWFLPAVPLFAASQLGRRATIRWGFVSVGTILFVYLSERLASLPPEFISSPWEIAFAASFLVVVVVGFAVSARSVDDRHIATIRAQAGELERARDVAVAAAAAKGQFLANMSHEIRTPLHGILGMTGLLAEAPLGAEQREMVGTIQKSGALLLNIVNDILDFSRLESEALQVERIPFSPVRALDDSLELIGTGGVARGLEVSAILDPTVSQSVQGDPTRFQQILGNLLSNAIKFTPAGGVVVEMSALEGWLQVRVRDTGIGIPPERVRELFQPFTQGDPSTTRKYGGTGLGLAICQRLAHQMGGHIEVESAAGRGSCFTLRLPAPEVSAPPERRFPGYRLLAVGFPPDTFRGLKSRAARLGAEVFEQAGPDFRPDVALLASPELAPRVAQGVPRILVAPPGTTSQGLEGFLSLPVLSSALTNELLRVLTRLPSSPQAAEDDPTPPSSHRVLVVEDNPVNQAVILRYLDRLGYGAEVACNGLEALEKLEAGDFALVLMDMQMPEMDGLQATREIRRRFPPERQPRIVALTANVLPQQRDEVLAAGADEFLAKPAQRADLAALLTRLGL